MAIGDAVMTIQNVCEPLAPPPAVLEYLDDAVNPTGCYPCDNSTFLRIQNNLNRVCF